MGRAEDFAHFVAVHGDDLAQRAYAMTGDLTRAQALLRDGLDQVYVDWDELGPGRRLSAARHGLQDRLGRVAVGQGDELEASALRESDLPLWDLLAILPPRQRAAVVERHLDEEPSPPAYRLAHAQLMAALRDVPELAGTLDTEMTRQIKVAVRDVSYPTGLAADVIMRAEQRQRRTIALAAAVLMVVLVFVGLALLPSISR